MTPDRIALEKVKSLLETITAVTKAFYERLISGQISEAKKTFPSIGEQLGILNSCLSKYWEVYQKYDLLGDLQSAKNSMLTAMLMLKGKLDAEEGLSEEEFARDPETYKALLIDAFKELVDQIINTATAEIEKVKNAIASLQPKAPSESFIPRDVTSTEHPDYAAMKNSAPDFKKAVIETEQKIREYPHTEDLHGLIQTGNWINYRHAHMPKRYGDFRIVYLWNKGDKELIYRIIGRHQDLGIN